MHASLSIKIYEIVFFYRACKQLRTPFKQGELLLQWRWRKTSEAFFQPFWSTVFIHALFIYLLLYVCVCACVNLCLCVLFSKFKNVHQVWSHQSNGHSQQLQMVFWLTLVVLLDLCSADIFCWNLHDCFVSSTITVTFGSISIQNIFVFF